MLYTLIRVHLLTVDQNIGVPSVMSAVREPRGEVLVGCFELLEVQLGAILVLQHRPRVCRRGSLCQTYQLVGPETSRELQNHHRRDII